MAPFYKSLVARSLFSSCSQVGPTEKAQAPSMTTVICEDDDRGDGRPGLLSRSGVCRSALRGHVLVVQPGLILAVHGADFLSSTNMPAWALLTSIILVSSLLNLFVGSASAKWALIAPVMVPMLMLLGITPEMATAAYRVGDGATNIITPLMVYFPLILIFCQRWQVTLVWGA